MRYKKWITVVCFSMVMMGMSGCGKSASDDTGTEVMGRVTSVSDSEITLAVFEKPDGDRPEGGKTDGKRPGSVSGGAFRQGEEPPEGTPPAGQKGEQPSEQTQKIRIDSGTKVYRQQGEEKTETTISDVQPGSMVTVVVDGEEAVSITIQSMEGRGSGRGKQNKGG